jgi:hypothetical protein
VITGVLFTALRSLAADRCYPNTFPQPIENAVWPAIRYQVISMDPEADVCGTDDGSTDTTHVQIDYVAKTYGAAVALRDLGRTALMSVSPPAIREPGGSETYDAETKTHRVTDDYSFHPSSDESS